MEDNKILSIEEINTTVRKLLDKYNADYALLFGSYARGEANSLSDIDLVVFGGKDFNPTDIFAFGEELRLITGKKADVFEIREIEIQSPIYHNIMKEGVKIA